MGFIWIYNRIRYVHMCTVNTPPVSLKNWTEKQRTTEKKKWEGHEAHKEPKWQKTNVFCYSKLYFTLFTKSMSIWMCSLNSDRTLSLSPFIASRIMSYYPLFHIQHALIPWMEWFCLVFVFHLIFLFLLSFFSMKIEKKKKKKTNNVKFHFSCLGHSMCNGYRAYDIRCSKRSYPINKLGWVKNALKILILLFCYVVICTLVESVEPWKRVNIFKREQEQRRTNERGKERKIAKWVYVTLKFMIMWSVSK